MQAQAFDSSMLDAHQAAGQEDLILDSLIACQCGKEFKPHIKSHMSIDEAFEYLSHHLPAYNYVRTQLINFIFSDGLTTGDEKQDEILNDWLYAKNTNGDTNYKVLQEAVAESMTFGRHGIRWLSKEDGVIGVKKQKYAPITKYNTKYYGFRDTVGYLVSFGKEKMHGIKLSELMQTITPEDIVREGAIVDKERKVIILSQDELLNVKHGLSTEHGQSVLEFDRQRILLLENWFSRLNYDIVYDGPGRIILYKKSGYESETDEQISMGKVMNKKVQQNNVSNSKQEIVALAKQIKDSKSDNVIVVSNAFEKNVTHLPRTTKATELLTYMTNNMESAVAQFFGVTPALFGLGKIAGNVSLEKIIDNAMLNSIIPIREMYAVQLSAFLAEKLGVDKIYFNKYNMQQQTDELDKQVKIVDMITKLTNAGYEALADSYANILAEKVEQIGKIRNLGIKVKKTFQRILKRRE